MRGIQARRNSSAPTSPPTWVPTLLVPAQVPSWPSLHRLGVMKAKRGVVRSLRRSVARCPVGNGLPSVPRVPRGTTLASHSAVSSMMEWNQTKGLWRVVYWSAAVANSAVSVAPRAGWAQSVPPVGSATPPSRAGVLPMSWS